MPTFLSKICKKSASTLVLIVACSPLIFAQCEIVKTQKNGATVFKSTETYQYVRSGINYNAVAFTLTATKKNNGVNYSLIFSYTGNATSPAPIAVNLVMETDKNISTKIKFVKVQKTDNPKLTIKQYEIQLAANDVEQLKQNPVKTFEFMFTARKGITISLADHNALQNRLNCLQNSVNAVL